MADLRKRFGTLVASHRRRRGLTQQDVAQAAQLSLEMVGKIEKGRTGARFPVIERLARVLDVDPAELFTPELPSGAMQRGAYKDISSQLACLSDPELTRVLRVLEAVTERRQ